MKIRCMISVKKVVGIVCLLCSISVEAQNRNLSGTVYDSDGDGVLPGVTILVENTNTGAITNDDGTFTLNVPEATSAVIFKMVGYLPKQVNITGKKKVDVWMASSNVDLDKVVVTALALTRQEKSLGYSISTVDDKTVTGSLQNNWMSTLSGKVAGLNVDYAGSGPGGSVRVTLRGEHSLNYGKNGALFVVDGVPIKSGATATSSTSNYANVDAPVDLGDGVSDLNSDDFASVTVLKGPAAAALYGANAANGVILITTKSGRRAKGWGVNYSGTVAMEQAGFFPDFQQEYGSGSDNGQNEYAFWELSADETTDGAAVSRNLSRYAFGEKFDANKMRYQYNSKDWSTGTYAKTPWIYQDDWYTGIFKTGVTYNNTISVEGSNEVSNVRFSFTDSRNEWILPNTGSTKDAFSLSFNSKLNPHLELVAKLNYIKKESDNLPTSGYDETSVMYDLAWGYNSNSINNWKNEYFQNRYNYANWSSSTGANGQSLVFPSTASYNPYRTLYEELNSIDNDRIIGNVGLTFHMLKGLSLNVKSGLDFDNQFRTQRKPFYTTDAPKGLYREQTIREYETNSDFLLQYINDSWVDDRLGFTAAFGGNAMVHDYSTTKITLTQLNDEGVYNTSNLPSGVYPDLYNYHSKKAVNSLYGFATISWDQTFYLDITGRNDWSSTLSLENCSFFYPSVSSSILWNRILQLQPASGVDLLKTRVSWANVGNGTDPYSLARYYSNTSFSGGYSMPGTIADPMIMPENVENWEVGLDARFFGNRVGLDLALYKATTTNQITSVDVDQIAGATSLKINAGEIENKGVEVALHLVPIQSKNFAWSMDVNWSKNKNILVSIQDGWDPEVPLQTDLGTTIGSRTFVYSYVGQEMNVLYGRGFKKAPEGSTYVDEFGNAVNCSGMDLVNGSTGYPELDSDPTTKIGNVNPDWKAGMTQRLRYKNLSLTMAFSGQFGGNCYSVTNFALSYQGKLTNSLAGRYDGLVHDGVNAVANSDGSVTYQKNEAVTNSIQTYYNSYVWNRNNTEMNTFSTTFLKLKEVRLDCQLPKRLCERMGFLQSASIGGYATNVFCLSEFPQYDPEAGMLNGNNIYKGIEAMTYPMTRTYGVNVKLSF